MTISAYNLNNEIPKLSMALPSNFNYKSKSKIVDKANLSGFGIYCSDIPQNHDLLQLLSSWYSKFSDIPMFGTAIISPLMYEPYNLIKNFKTAFEILGNKLEIGLGVGDPNLLSKKINRPVAEFFRFSDIILRDKTLEEHKSMFSFAGSGKKILEKANNYSIGIIFNGIPNERILNSIDNEITRKNFSIYIMVDLEEINNKSYNFYKVIIRMIATLPKSEQIRLKITSKELELAKNILKEDSNSFHEYEKLNNAINKISFRGNLNNFEKMLLKFNKLNVKQVIISTMNNEARNLIFDHFSKF